MGFEKELTYIERSGLDRIRTGDLRHVKAMS